MSWDKSIVTGFGIGSVYGTPTTVALDALLDVTYSRCRVGHA